MPHQRVDLLARERVAPLRLNSSAPRVWAAAARGTGFRPLYDVPLLCACNARDSTINPSCKTEVHLPGGFHHSINCTHFGRLRPSSASTESLAPKDRSTSFSTRSATIAHSPPRCRRSSSDGFHGSLQQQPTPHSTSVMILGGQNPRYRGWKGGPFKHVIVSTTILR